jgi:uncharacterized membrane protein YcaP (DUF421 family)
MVIAFVRTIVLYLLIFAGIRLMGKRQVENWSRPNWCSP